MPDEVIVQARPATCPECESPRVVARAMRPNLRQSARLAGALMELDMARALGDSGRITYRFGSRAGLRFDGRICLDCGAGVALAQYGPHTIALLQSEGRQLIAIDGRPI